MADSRLGRRALLLGASALALPWASGRLAAARPTPDRPPLPPPPATPRIATVRRQLGRERTDWYAWLKSVPASGQRSLDTVPPPIRTQLLAENGYADRVLARTAAVRAELLAQMTARVPAGDAEPPVARGGWLYGRDQSGPHPVWWRQRPDGTGRQVLLDEGARARGHAYYRTTRQQVSPDGRFYAWAEDVGGNDRHRLCVSDIAAGVTRTVVATDAYGYGGVAFSPSSRWLFWIWRDARNRPTRVFRTPVAGGAAALVYEERDPAIFMALSRTAADGFVALTLSGPDTAEVRLVPRGGEEASPRLVWPRQAGRRYSVNEWNGGLVALVEDDAAPDGRVVALSQRGFTEGKVLVPHRAGQQILEVRPFAQGLVLLERRDADPLLAILDPAGVRREVALGTGPRALSIPPEQDHAAPTCRVVLETPSTPAVTMAVPLGSGHAPAAIARQRVAGHDPARFAVRRLFATAPDGAQVPITLLTARDARADATAPLLLYGYGAYGVSTEAGFAVPPTVMAARGWSYAIAHVRGGSEKGRGWFLDGRRRLKHHSFDDFVACARHLAASGWAAADKLVAHGLSAGGLLVGASMNRAPDVWAGVIAEVPFVDMLNTMSDADHPLVPLFRPDWGDPLADRGDYDYIASISPYENVQPVAYPPLLCTAGLKDDRVGYWEPAKLVAAVRRASTANRPAMLLTDLEAGHQGSGGRDDTLRRTARLYAFAEGCVRREF